MCVLKQIMFENLQLQKKTNREKDITACYIWYEQLIQCSPISGTQLVDNI